MSLYSLTDDQVDFLEQALRATKDVNLPALGATLAALQAPVVPTVVLNVEGGAWHGMDSDNPVRVIVLDSDTENADEDDLQEVDGEEVYVIDRLLDRQVIQRVGDGIDAIYVASVASQLTSEG